MGISFTNLKEVHGFYYEAWDFCVDAVQRFTLHNLLMQGRTFHC